jgi:hypothetical protein
MRYSNNYDEVQCNIARIQISEENGEVRRLTTNNLKISYFYTQGTFIEVDVTSNSQFMLCIMPTFGTEIHE